MQYSQYKKLTFRQQLTIMIAMHVRNSMEDLHDGLSDAQMKQLNQTIRQAIYDVLGVIDVEANSVREREEAAVWLVNRVPPDWEIPDTPSGALMLR